MILEQSEIYQWFKTLGLLDTPKATKTESKAVHQQIWGSALHVADVIAMLRGASHLVKTRHPGASGKFFVDGGSNTTEPAKYGQGNAPRMVVNDNFADDPADTTGIWFYPMGPPPGWTVYDYDREILEEGTIW